MSMTPKKESSETVACRMHLTNCREVGGGGGYRVIYLDAVTAAGTAHTPYDFIILPLFARDLVVIRSFFGRTEARFETTCGPYQLDKFSAAEVKPKIPVRARKAGFPCEGSTKMI